MSRRYIGQSRGIERDRQRLNSIDFKTHRNIAETRFPGDRHSRIRLISDPYKNGDFPSERTRQSLPDRHSFSDRRRSPERISGKEVRTRERFSLELGKREPIPRDRASSYKRGGGGGGGERRSFCRNPISNSPTSESPNVAEKKNNKEFHSDILVTSKKESFVVEQLENQITLAKPKKLYTLQDAVNDALRREEERLKREKEEIERAKKEEQEQAESTKKAAEALLYISDTNVVADSPEKKEEDSLVTLNQENCRMIEKEHYGDVEGWDRSQEDDKTTEEEIARKEFIEFGNFNDDNDGDSEYMEEGSKNKRKRSSDAEESVNQNGDDEEIEEPPLPPPQTIYDLKNKFPVATSIEKYECVSHISHGTFGVVFKGRCKETGKMYAMKRFRHPDKADSSAKEKSEPQFIHRYALKEISALTRLSHPHIINVHEVVYTEMRNACKVMSLMAFDLKNILDKRKVGLSLPEVKCIFLQLMSALEYMHHNWYMHRDLKPANVLYDNKGCFKLCDFGLARSFGNPTKAYTPLVQTLWYRAPEILLSTEKYSCAIDIWSAGCMFGELICGKPLFPGEGEVNQLHKIFDMLGDPTPEVWPDMVNARFYHILKFRKASESKLRERMFYAVNGVSSLSDLGIDLLEGMLTYDPEKRLTATEVIAHPFFKEEPVACLASQLPSY